MFCESHQSPANYLCGKQSCKQLLCSTCFDSHNPAHNTAVIYNQLAIEYFITGSEDQMQIYRQWAHEIATKSYSFIFNIKLKQGHPVDGLPLISEKEITAVAIECIQSKLSTITANMSFVRENFSLSQLLIPDFFLDLYNIILEEPQTIFNPICEAISARLVEVYKNKPIYSFLLFTPASRHLFEFEGIRKKRLEGLPEKIVYDNNPSLAGTRRSTSFAVSNSKQAEQSVLNFPDSPKNITGSNQKSFSRTAISGNRSPNEATAILTATTLLTVQNHNNPSSQIRVNVLSEQNTKPDLTIEIPKDQIPAILAGNRHTSDSSSQLAFTRSPKANGRSSKFPSSNEKFGSEARDNFKDLNTETSPTNSGRIRSKLKIQQFKVDIKDIKEQPIPLLKNGSLVEQPAQSKLFKSQDMCMSETVETSTKKSHSVREQHQPNLQIIVKANQSLTAEIAKCYENERESKAEKSALSQKLEQAEAESAKLKQQLIESEDKSNAVQSNVMASLKQENATLKKTIASLQANSRVEFERERTQLLSQIQQYKSIYEKEKEETQRLEKERANLLVTVKAAQISETETKSLKAEIKMKDQMLLRNQVQFKELMEKDIAKNMEIEQLRKEILRLSSVKDSLNPPNSVFVSQEQDMDEELLAEVIELQAELEMKSSDLEVLIGCVNELVTRHGVDRHFVVGKLVQLKTVKVHANQDHDPLG